jgi:uncharacterized protein (TIGR03083 family)
MRDVVLTAHLFRPLAAELLALLHSLEPDAWSRQTSAGEWLVRDVVAHLLDGDLRRLSSSRDAHPPPPPERPITGADDLLTYLDTLNAEWVRAARRLSPRMLTHLLDTTTQQLAELMEAADPLAPATFPVAWAGQQQSPMWVDVGREYTERWHHQDQIREAVGAPPLSARDWLRPVLDISLLALPHAWRKLRPSRAARVALHVSGDSGGAWVLDYAASWRLLPGEPADKADCTIEVGDLQLARLLLHRLTADAARAAVSVTGSEDLAEPLFAARAVMARATPPDVPLP